VQRWCGQQTLSLKNASFHVLRVASLIYKFHAAFLYPVYIQDYVEIYLLTWRRRHFFLQDSAGPRQIVTFPWRNEGLHAEEAGKHPPLGTSVTDSKHFSSTFKDIFWKFKDYRPSDKGWKKAL
jgi:hypothetical protein